MTGAGSDPLRPAPLRIGVAPLVRPVFKGDAAAALRTALADLRALGAEHGFEVVTPRVDSPAQQAVDGARVPAEAITDAAEAARAARELAAAELDLLLIVHVTFATGDLLAPLVRAHPRVGVWALPESAGGSGTAGPLPLNALCGLTMTLSLLERPAVARTEPVKWFYGAADGERFRERLLPTLGALRALRALQGATVLQIGGTAPGFYGIEEHPHPDAFAGLDVTVETLPLSALFERVSAADPAAAAVRAAAMQAGHRVEVRDDQLMRAARIEVALAGLAAEVGADALAVRCWPELPERCDSMACAAMGDLAAAGTPAACEGDVMGALSMVALQGLTGASAALMDLSDLDADGAGAVQLWHCGNAPLAWAAGVAGAAGPPPRLTTHFNRDGVGVVRDMTLRPGPASGFRLLDGGRRAAIVSGSFGEPARAGFDGVRGWLGELRWNGVPVSAWQLIGNVLGRRLPHHLAIGAGENTPALAELCAWLGAEIVEARPVGAQLVR